MVKRLCSFIWVVTYVGDGVNTVADRVIFVLATFGVTLTSVFEAMGVENLIAKIKDVCKVHAKERSMVEDFNS